MSLQLLPGGLQQGDRLPGPKITFKLRRAPIWAVTARNVFADGEDVGVLYGVNPSPYNEHRPTAFDYYPASGAAVVRYDRLEEARHGISTGIAEKPTRPALRIVGT